MTARGCKSELYWDLVGAVHAERRFGFQALKMIAKAEKESLHLREGYSSMFAFLTKKLGFSDSGAVRRIKVARSMTKVPEFEQFLKERRLDLTAASLIASLKEPKQIREILAQAKGKSFKEVEELVGAKRPQSVMDQRDRLKQVSVFKISEEKTGKDQQKGGTTVGPQTEIKLRVEFTANKSLKDKIERAKELLSGKHPKGAKLEQVFEAALDEFISKKERKPRKTKVVAKPDSRYIPASLRDQIMERDSYCCSYQSEDGQICQSRWDLEIDHIEPHCLGGKTEAKNLRVLCRAHNMFVAKEKIGWEMVEGKFN